MKSLILFGSKYGTAEESANKLKSYLKGDVEIIDIKKDKNISLSNYEKVIIGTSVYAGMINKDIKNFIENNKAELVNKKLGLFTCCMSDGEKVIEQFNQNIPKEVLEAAKVKESFGGEFKFSKMNFFEKTIIKMIYKKDKSLGTVNGKSDISKINEDAIKNFAMSIN